jgi:DnaJ-domain-containing protein 1
LRANLIIKESPFLIVVVPAALIGIVGLLALGRRRAVDGNAREDAPQQPAEEQVVGGEEGADDQEKLRQARFVRYSPDLRGGGIRDEYEDLLAVFGVRPGVKLVHIKNAYRSAVKSCHPDLHRNASSGEAEKFIYLTQTYERLLRLHAERTGER